MLLTKIECNIPLKEGDVLSTCKRWNGGSTYWWLNISRMYCYLQSYTQVLKLLYFIGVGFGGLEAMNSMAGFGGVGRMGGKWMYSGSFCYLYFPFYWDMYLHTHVGIDAVGSSKDSLALEDTCRDKGGLCSECMR